MASVDDPQDWDTTDPGTGGGPNPSDPPDMIWRDVCSLNDFENDINLPEVCKYCEDSDHGKIPLGLKTYCEKPLLFYTRCKKRQVRARTMYKDTTGNFYEVGQTILIPDNFDGIFELVPPDFSRGPYCRNISEIAKIMPKKFFTRSNITAIRITEDGGEQGYKERKISAGSILRVSSTFSAKWRTSAETVGLLKSKKKKQEWTTYEIQYLKCIDKDSKEILVPFTCKGKFNIVYERGMTDPRTIFRIKDILTEFGLPVKVRLIYGKAPVVPCIFTGMLILKDDFFEESVVCSTIINRRNVLLELPVNMPCKVQKVENEESYVDRKTYQDAKKLCHKYADSYASLIKLSPDMDTDQKMILHIPTERTKHADDTLKTINMVTNMSLTEEEPVDAFMDSSSDTDSVQNSERKFNPSEMLLELKEITLDNSQSGC